MELINAFSVGAILLYIVLIILFFVFFRIIVISFKHSKRNKALLMFIPLVIDFIVFAIIFMTFGFSPIRLLYSHIVPTTPRKTTTTITTGAYGFITKNGNCNVTYDLFCQSSSPLQTTIYFKRINDGIIYSVESNKDGSYQIELNPGSYEFYYLYNNAKTCDSLTSNSNQLLNSIFDENKQEVSLPKELTCSTVLIKDNIPTEINTEYGSYVSL